MTGEAGVDTQFLAMKTESKLDSLNLFKKGYVLADPNSPICCETVQ